MDIKAIQLALDKKSYTQDEKQHVSPQPSPPQKKKMAVIIGLTSAN